MAAATPDLVNASVQALLSMPIIQEALRKLDAIDARKADEKARRKAAVVREEDKLASPAVSSGAMRPAAQAAAAMNPEQLAHSATQYATECLAEGEVISYSEARAHVVKEVQKGKLSVPAPAPVAPVVQPVIDESGIGEAEFSESVKQYCLRESEAGREITYDEGRREVLKKLRKGKLLKVVTAAREAVVETALYQQRHSSLIERSSSSDAALRRKDRAVALCEKATRRGEKLSYSAALDMAIDEGL